MKEILEDIDYLPDVTGFVEKFPFDSENMEIKKDGFFIILKHEKNIILILDEFFEDGGEALLKVHLKRENSHCNLRVKAQKGSKQKVKKFSDFNNI